MVQLCFLELTVCSRGPKIAYSFNDRSLIEYTPKDSGIRTKGLGGVQKSKLQASEFQAHDPLVTLHELESKLLKADYIGEYYGGYSGGY